MKLISYVALSCLLLNPTIAHSDERIYQTKNICGRYYATEINGMEMTEQVKYLQELAKRMPTVTTLVQSRMAQLQVAEMQAMQQVAPEAAVGEESGQQAAQENIELSSDQKQKGPTKGNV